MSLEFCSIEDAWGDNNKVMYDTASLQVSVQSNAQNVTQRHPNKSKSINNRSSLMTTQNHINTDMHYYQPYCESILNHIQSCEYCKSYIQKHIFQCENCEDEKDTKDVSEQHLQPTILRRNHDNMAYIPFNLDPEVFNVLLFSLLSITLLFLLDKRELKDLMKLLK